MTKKNIEIIGNIESISTINPMNRTNIKITITAEIWDIKSDEYCYDSERVKKLHLGKCKLIQEIE